jgi:hypothetical protein
LITHHPLRITAVIWGWLGGDVRGEAKFADERVEETTPFGVIGLDKIKVDRDMGVDIDCQQDGRRWRANGGQDVLDRGGVRGLRGGVGGREIEEGIRIHVHDGGSEERIGREAVEETGADRDEQISDEKHDSGCGAERRLGSNHAS